MRCISILVPELLLERIDDAARDLDPSAPNRSAWLRAAMIAKLRREVNDAGR
jgi:metal-responsive CopG/Arc/MetJ family transcriptional regulator